MSMFETNAVHAGRGERMTYSLDLKIQIRKIACTFVD